MVRYQQNYHKGTVGLLIFLILPFLGLSGIKEMMSPTLYQVWQSGSTLFLALFLTVKIRIIRLNWAVILFTLYQAVIIFSSTFNNGISLGIIVVTIVSIILFLILQSEYCREVLIAVSIIIIVSVVINIPTMLPRIGEENAKYFIGGKNALGTILIPGAFILLISCLETNGIITKSAIIVLILCALTVIIGSSGTGIVVVACTIILLFVSNIFKPTKAIYLGVIFSAYVLLLIFSEIFLTTDLWLNFTDFLGKSSSLTSRTTIWRLAGELFRGNWLFGAGRGVEIAYINTWGEKQVIYEAHNFILEILMEGGFVGLALFGTLFFKATKGLNMSNIKHKMVFIALCVLLINGLTESTVNGFLVIIILGTACRYATVENKLKN